MSKLLLISGNFYKDGQKVAPAFGDKEQIALMEAYDSMMNYGTIAHPVEDGYDEIIGWSVRCFCGQEVIFDEQEDMDGIIEKCKCGLRYICHADQDNFLTIKLKPKKL